MTKSEDAKGKKRKVLKRTGIGVAICTAQSVTQIIG